MGEYVHMYGARQVGPSPATHPTEGAFMVPGMGAQPVPPPKYVPANDNVVDWRVPVGNDDLPWIGNAPLTRHGDPNGCADDLVTTTFAPLELVISDEKADAMMVGRPTEGGYTVTDERAGISVTIDVAIDGRGKLVPSVRHGDFMQTFTGRKFWPMDPRANEICIRDIAHSLSLQCRYAGHCRRFYSVAEHCVHIARWLVGIAPEAALWGLLHDASEAFLIDVPRPVKPFLSGYKAAESKVMAAVCQRFGLPLEMPAAVHEADERIIADELVNLVRMQWHARHDDPLGVPLQYWSPAEAEEEFLETFKALTGEVS